MSISPPGLIDKRVRLTRLCAQAMTMQIDDLVTAIRLKATTPTLSRIACLRVLVFKAPLSVTLGRCYAQRRRLVRKHYGC